MLWVDGLDMFSVFFKVSDAADDAARIGGGRMSPDRRAVIFDSYTKVRIFSNISVG